MSLIIIIIIIIIIIVTMTLSRTVSEINGDFCRKSKKKSTSRVFCALADGVPLGIGYRRMQLKN